jgi:hypothetical protein
MKAALIILVSLAVVLGIITYFALFSGPQIVQPIQTAQNQTSTQTASATASTATTSAFIGGASSSNAVTAGSSTTSGIYQTMFAPPYPITWTEGQPQLAIMGGTLRDDQLTLSVNIQMGTTPQCVPINLRLITDEQGDMAAPNTPASPNFPLAPDGTCEGDSETSYSESVTFTVNPASMPFLFSTGDPANAFFEISTTTDNGLRVDVPQKNG